MKEEIAKDILEQFKIGNQKAFSLIYERYYMHIFLFVRRFVIDEQVAEEITAETFLKLWRIRENIEPLTRSIEGFLHITARNDCLNYLKKSNSIESQKEALQYFFTYQYDDGNYIDKIEAEVLTTLLKQIELLPTQCRKVFKLAYYSGLSNKEISEKLNIAYRTVVNQKQRAITLLQARIMQRDMIVLFAIFSSTTLSVLESSKPA